ncbi:MAG: DinB family protein [bacterium]|nr:DinB family protein [bacterium]
MQAGTKIKKPQEGLYHPFFKRYMDQISEDQDLIAFYVKQFNEFKKFVQSELISIQDYAYAEGKWSVKEVIGHCIDVERIMSYRLLSIARGDRTSLPGFDEDPYVEESNFSNRSVESLLEEFEVVRKSTMLLIKNLLLSDFERVGESNGSPTSVSALAYMIPGHLSHHVQVLKERYL